MAAPDQIIDILIVIDAESLMEQFQNRLSTDPKRPTFIGTETSLIYMFVRRDEVVHGLATSDLNVRVNPEDVINWRAISLTLNTQYSVLLTASEVTQGQDFISKPIPNAISVYVPTPKVDPKTHEVTVPDKQTIADFYFHPNAQSGGVVTYTFSFAVTQNDGRLLGYFKWDPKLSVS